MALLGAGLWGLLALSSARPAGARSEADIAYTREQTFSAALRYLRVDLAYEVTEKDSDAAYLLFSFPAPELEDENANGSIEVVQTDHSVKLLVSLPQLPSYHEEVLKRGLLQKLRKEYGEPPARDRRKRGAGDPKQEGERDPEAGGDSERGGRKGRSDGQPPD